MLSFEYWVLHYGRELAIATKCRWILAQDNNFSTFSDNEAFALSRFFMLPGQADDASGNTGNRKFSEFGVTSQ